MSPPAWQHVSRCVGMTRTFSSLAAEIVRVASSYVKRETRLCGPSVPTSCGDQKRYTQPFSPKSGSRTTPVSPSSLACVTARVIAVVVWLLSGSMRRTRPSRST